MFVRLIADSFTRRPRRKMLTAAALALGMAVATAALTVWLNVGDRVAREFRGLGANLIVAPAADSLPLQIGGVDYRPANAGALLPDADIPKLKTIFWRNNIIGIAPVLDVPVKLSLGAGTAADAAPLPVEFIGTWADHSMALPDGNRFTTGMAQTNPWWRVEGRWYSEASDEALMGEKLAREAHLGIGSRVRLQAIGGTRKEWSATITGILSTGGAEDETIVGPLPTAQTLAEQPGKYRRLYVSALTKPEDAFARRDPKSMTRNELERWSCSPYVSSIAYSIAQALPGTSVAVNRRVAEGEGRILTRVRVLLGLVTLAALLAAGLAVGASSAAAVIERRTEIGLMKALGAGSSTVGLLLVAEQLLMALAGGGIGYSAGVLLARVLGERVFGFAPETSWLLLVLVLVLAVAVTLAGSAIPLRRAARYEPAPILRGE
jgi:putative ABC transport system permease protein